MRIVAIVLAIFVQATGLFAQQPQSKPLFEKTYDERGCTVKIGNRSFGPYESVGPFATNSDGSVVAIAAQHPKGFSILTQGQVFGPYDPAFYVTTLHVWDSGKLWIAKASADEKEILIVNGKLYGPALSIAALTFATSAQAWIAVVNDAPSSYRVLVSGQEYGPFPEVPMTWLSPDGSFWAFVVSREDGTNDFYTSTKTWKNVASVQTDSLNFDRPIWGYKIVERGNEETYVVGSKAFTGYRYSGSLVVAPAGKHWGFEALKPAEDSDRHVVVVDGVEYPGETLSVRTISGKTSFVWYVENDFSWSFQSLEVR